MAVVGTAYIAIRPTGEGEFEAALIKDVKSAVAAAEKGAVITPVANTSKATGPLDLLKSKLTSFAGAGNPVTKVLGDVTSASGGAEGALAGVASGGFAVAGAAAVAFAAKSVSAFQEYAGGARAVQRVTGASAEDASKLAAAFRAVGIAPEQAAPSLGRFARNLATNSEALGKLGVEIAKNKDGTTNMKETFLNVADAVAKAKDPTEALNLSMTAFGRSGQQLLPVLQKGREGITELFGEAAKHGQLFNQKDLDTSKELTMAWREVKETIEGVFVTVGKYIAPFLVDLVHVIQDVEDISSHVPNMGKAFKAAFIGALGPLGTLVEGMHAISGVLDKITGKHRDHKSAVEADAAATADDADTTDELAGAADAAAKATAAATKAAEDHKKAIDTLQGAITDITKAQKTYKDGLKDVTDAQGHVREAQQKLSDLQKKGVIDLAAVATAQKSLADSSKGLADAQQKVADAAQKVTDATAIRVSALQRQSEAQDALNKLISGQAAAEDLVAHKHDLEHANLAVREATKSLTEAEAKRAEVVARQGVAEAKLAALRLSHTATQADLDAAQADVTQAGADYANDLADAQLGVDEATLSLSESQENLITTQQTLNDIQNEGKTGSDKLKAAQQLLATSTADVDAATRGLAGAQRDQTTAAADLVTAQNDVITKQGELKTALAPDPKLQADIAQAVKDVKEGWEKVRDAQFDASTKAADLAIKQGALKDIAHNSIPDLQEVQRNLKEIVTLQPQAAAFMGPTLDMINSLVSAATATFAASIVGWKPLPAGISGPPSPIFKPHAAGGYDSGSFYAGENGVELVSLRPGGGAMVYAAGSPEARGGGGMPPVSIEIQAHFGPGTNAADVVAAMRSVAQNEITAALKAVLAKASAGNRR